MTVTERAGSAAEIPLMEGWAEGVIPYPLRIGVTGHRSLPDDPALVERVRQAIGRIREIAPSSPTTPVRLAVLSPLAEGADRFVAREVLNQPDAILEAALPMPAELYMDDFETPDSRAEFNWFLQRADVIGSLPACETREAAYEQAGRYVTDRCDALIALWDGQPARGRGGTAHVVEWARERGVPLFWISTMAPYDLHEEPGSGISTAAFHKLDAFNASSIDPDAFHQELTAETGQILKACEAAGLDHSTVQPFCNWILPRFVRADLLATASQKRFYLLGSAIFWASAAAVIVVAAQVLFFPDVALLALAEVALMLLILGSLSVGRRSRAHERWTSYRFLAEHFRARLYLALVGVGSNREADTQPTQLQQPSEEWLRRAIDEVWEERPLADITRHDVGRLRAFLASTWIGGQLRYQERAGHRNREKHHQIHHRTQAIFIITLVAALLHVVTHLIGLGEKVPLLGSSLVFLSLSLPPCAGAVHGIGAQREYVRSAERSEQMVPYLQRIKQRMEVAPDIEEVRRLAQESEQIMLSENRDWFVVMQFHDVELHV